MPNDQEIKIVPVKSLPRSADAQQKKPSYVPWLTALIGVYFTLMLLVSFLPMAGYMKVLSLVLGAFLVFDLLHSFKWYVKNR